MTSGKGSRGGLARRILDKKVEQKSGRRGNWKVELPIVTSQARTQKKKEKYVGAVKNFVMTEKSLNS